MKEGVLQTKIKNYLVGKGAYVETIWGGGFQASGIPDLVGCYRGYFVGVEVKVGKGKPSPIQLVKIQQINNAGGYGIVAWDLETVEELIEGIDKELAEKGQGEKL